MEHCIILYGSPTKLSKAHKAVHHAGPYGKGRYYVRMKVVRGGDLEAALRMAKPMAGETVLNTVPMETA